MYLINDYMYCIVITFMASGYDHFSSSTDNLGLTSILPQFPAQLPNLIT